MAVSKWDNMSEQNKLLIPKIYFALTPAFILLDYFGGMNIRIAVLDSYPTYKGLYYGFCILCGIITFFIPRFSPVIALFESIAIYLMTILGVFVPYFQLIQHADLNTDFQLENIMTAPYITNLVLAGFIAVFTFHTSLEVIGISDNESI